MQEIPIKSEITASVWKILVQPGDSVIAGQDLMILESMKMEIPLQSPAAGTIRSLSVAEGQSITEGELVAMVAMVTSL